MRAGQGSEAWSTGDYRGDPVFLTREGVNLVLMFSGKPIAQETCQWLAGEVMPAIADTGGYLLNEAARETARVAENGELRKYPGVGSGPCGPSPRVTLEAHGEGQADATLGPFPFEPETDAQLHAKHVAHSRVHRGGIAPDGGGLTATTVEGGFGPCPWLPAGSSGPRQDARGLISFAAGDSKVRAFALDGAVWIVGADVVTGLTLVNASFLYSRLGDDEVLIAPRDLVRGLNALKDGRGHGAGMKTAKLVSESGFYKLVMRSDKPEARAFQEWVTREVLPAIRQTGGYRLQDVAPEAVQEGTVNEMLGRSNSNPDFRAEINPR